MPDKVVKWGCDQIHRCDYAGFLMCSSEGVWLLFWLPMLSRDFDPYDLRIRLPVAVAQLHKAIEAHKNKTAYIHCTAGLGRAPGVAVRPSLLGFKFMWRFGEVLRCSFVIGDCPLWILLTGCAACLHVLATGIITQRIKRSSPGQPMADTLPIIVYSMP